MQLFLQLKIWAAKIEYFFSVKTSQNTTRAAVKRKIKLAADLDHHRSKIKISPDLLQPQNRNVRLINRLDKLKVRKFLSLVLQKASKHSLKNALEQFDAADCIRELISDPVSLLLTFLIATNNVEALDLLLNHSKKVVNYSLVRLVISMPLNVPWRSYVELANLLELPQIHKLLNCYSASQKIFDLTQPKINKSEAIDCLFELMRIYSAELNTWGYSQKEFKVLKALILKSNEFKSSKTVNIYYTKEQPLNNELVALNPRKLNVGLAQNTQETYNMVENNNYELLARIKQKQCADISENAYSEPTTASTEDAIYDLQAELSQIIFQSLQHTPIPDLFMSSASKVCT